MTGIFVRRKSYPNTSIPNGQFFLFAINPTMLMRRPYFYSTACAFLYEQALFLAAIKITRNFGSSKTV